ncbi:MAG: CBS domain-containing protein [Clostridiales bacterium]|nr:CBS domain-containing protein [Candidatus Apopatousia equi]
MDNAERFLRAYNNLDYSLRIQYNFKRSMAFSDVIRRSVVLNSVVRKYEDLLVDYGRLRNAIIHSGNETEVIAEPHLNVVEKMEKIASLVCTPPKVLDTICKKDVLCIKESETLEKTMITISKSGYSNLPVYEGDELIGVANGQKLMDNIGKVLSNGYDLNDYIKKTSIKEAMSVYVGDLYYTIENQDLTLEKALDLFYRNRKLLVILITKNGIKTEKPLGIVSVADVMDINNILENY